MVTLSEISMRPLFVGLVLFVAACGSSTEPGNRLDPSLLFNNQLSTPVYLTWQDGDAIIGYDTIPAHTSGHCSHFLAQPDSAYFQIIATESNGGTPFTTTITAPWFHPEDRPAWAVDITSNPNGSPIVLITEVDTMCELP